MGHDVADDGDPLTRVDGVRAGGAHQAAAHADAVVHALLHHGAREARSKAELIQAVQVVDVERGQPLGRTGEGREGVAADHHPQHAERGVELVQVADRGLVQLGALEIGVARLEDALEDRVAAVVGAHQEERLGHETLVVHRQCGRPAGVVVGHRPRHPRAVRAVQVAERVGGIEPITTQEGRDLTPIPHRAGAEPMGCRDRHRYRCPGGQ